MPRKPPRPCRYPGCPELTFDRSGYCIQHKRTVAKSYERTRETAVKRGYTRRWRKVREMKLNRDPFCECGCGKPATVVHHINGDPRDNRMANLMSLAHECHSRLHGRQGDRWQGVGV